MFTQCGRYGSMSHLRNYYNPIFSDKRSILDFIRGHPSGFSVPGDVIPNIMLQAEPARDNNTFFARCTHVTFSTWSQNK